MDHCVFCHKLLLGLLSPIATSSGGATGRGAAAATGEETRPGAGAASAVPEGTGVLSGRGKEWSEMDGMSNSKR